MMAGLNNLWRGYDTNPQLSFQSIRGLGVGLRPGRGMGHLALGPGCESNSELS